MVTHCVSHATRERQEFEMDLRKRKMRGARLNNDHTPEAGYGNAEGFEKVPWRCFRTAASHTANPQLMSRCCRSSSSVVNRVGVFANNRVRSCGHCNASGS